mmetsp:Transcript_43963/g.140906  ORF Transcript_43963/g.140906 Transcript_43963/m.140906 type:complete len:229 (+) Transcript_43963:519-1205(+)
MRSDGWRRLARRPPLASRLQPWPPRCRRYGRTQSHCSRMQSRMLGGQPQRCCSDLGQRRAIATWRCAARWPCCTTPRRRCGSAPSTSLPPWAPTCVAGASGRRRQRRSPVAWQTTHPRCGSRRSGQSPRPPPPVQPRLWRSCCPTACSTCAGPRWRRWWPWRARRRTPILSRYTSPCSRIRRPRPAVAPSSRSPHWAQREGSPRRRWQPSPGSASIRIGPCAGLPLRP